MNPSPSVAVVGAGLAGCEAALQLAHRGVSVTLYEQKPGKRTEAQTSPHFAELVCSNSFRGASLENAVGLLKEEMRLLGSALIEAASRTQVPAGGALSVDRERFAAQMTDWVKSHPNITVVQEEVTCLPITDADVTLVATGPLTSPALTTELQRLTGADQLYFYDAIAPILDAESIDKSIAFYASRYDKGDGDDYLNLPLNEEQYEAFVDDLLAAKKVTVRAFEEPKYFEGCMPIEVMAERGRQTLAFGPMKPVGLTDPRTGERSHAVVQLRAENREKTAYNMVGFQTRMTFPEQKRVFQKLPGLAKAEFLRFGSIHRNTFLNSPSLLSEDLSLKGEPGLFFGGADFRRRRLCGKRGQRDADGHVLGLPLDGTSLPLPRRNDDARCDARPAAHADGGLSALQRELRPAADAALQAQKAGSQAPVRGTCPGRFGGVERRPGPFAPGVAVVKHEGPCSIHWIFTPPCKGSSETSTGSFS